jgi:AraC family transcriptional regulator
MQAGEVIVTPAGEPKSWRREGAGTVLVIAVSPAFLDGVLEQASGRHGAHSELLDNFGTRDARIEAIAGTLWDELQEERLGGRMYADAAFTQLALHLLRQYSSFQPSVETAVPISAYKLRSAMSFIQANLGENLTVIAIARAIGMSPFHFAHAFRAATGLPPHKFVMQRRLEMAKSLLRTTKLSLTDIAQRVGYSSPSHFSAGFQRLARVSPSDYRKRP